MDDQITNQEAVPSPPTYVVQFSDRVDVFWAYLIGVFLGLFGSRMADDAPFWILALVLIVGSLVVMFGYAVYFAYRRIHQQDALIRAALRIANGETDERAQSYTWYGVPNNDDDQS